MIETSTLDGGEVYLSTKELADRWRIDEKTLANQRSSFQGLPYTKIGGRVLYKMEDVLAVEVEGQKGFTWSQIDDAMKLHGGSDEYRAAVMTTLGKPASM